MFGFNGILRWLILCNLDTQRIKLSWAGVWIFLFAENKSHFKIMGMRHSRRPSVKGHEHCLGQAGLHVMKILRKNDCCCFLLYWPSRHSGAQPFVWAMIKRRRLLIFNLQIQKYGFVGVWPRFQSGNVTLIKSISQKPLTMSIKMYISRRNPCKTKVKVLPAGKQVLSSGITLYGPEKCHFTLHQTPQTIFGVIWDSKNTCLCFYRFLGMEVLKILSLVTEINHCFCLTVLYSLPVLIVFVGSFGGAMASVFCG